MSPQVVQPNAQFDWPKVAFSLYKTNGYVKYVYKGDAWGPAEWVNDDQISLPVGSVALNYGASVFEGLKAFRHPDGQVKIFRPKDNAERISYSGEFVSLPAIPEETFLEAVHTAVAKNLEWVPPHAPYGGSGSMYLRPLLFASGANLILAPPSEFTFIVYVTPTGSLYGTAGTKAPAVDALILDTFDRAAPKGCGTAKLAGNYAPVFKYMAGAKAEGYAITLHLDSGTRTKIDEFSTSNFLGIKNGKNGEPTTLVVPTSDSILNSVTKRAIISIAESFGWKVDRREVLFEQVLAGELDEVCACGTAAAITPIRSISYKDESGATKKVSIGDGENAGPGFLSILEHLVGIQSGTKDDSFGWCWPQEGVDGQKLPSSIKA